MQRNTINIVRPVQENQLPPKLSRLFTPSLCAAALLFWGLAEQAQAHGINLHLPNSLPACTARALVCEAPSSTFSARNASTAASAQFERVPTTAKVEKQKCIDGAGVPRSCALSGPFQYMPQTNTSDKDVLAAAQTLNAISATDCTNGIADLFPCSNVDLLAFMPINDIGGSKGNDIWGWTDPDTGKEYALMGRRNGTAFVDISTPEEPIYIGNLPSQDGIESTWRDIKVYEEHVFIVVDDSSQVARTHGMQVFDLTQLRASAIQTATLPLTLSATAVYTEVYGAHNVAINEETGYAYLVGSTHSDNIDSRCRGGLHMVDISTPASPTFAGCFDSDGYTHDTQCVIYSGPDAAYQGREICFNSNEDTLTIVDVTDKENPAQLARVWYESLCASEADSKDPLTRCFFEGGSLSFYTHQGWLTDDQRYFLQDDEYDEAGLEHNTRTYVWDVADLVNPVLHLTHTSNIETRDHNLYVHDNYVYQANYRSGLRVLDAANIAEAGLFEVAYFDTFPSTDDLIFSGAWSNYPYFESGVVIVSTIDEGLFVLRPNLSRTTVISTYMPFIWQE